MAAAAAARRDAGPGTSIRGREGGDPARPLARSARRGEARALPWRGDPGPPRRPSRRSQVARGERPPPRAVLQASPAAAAPRVTAGAGGRDPPPPPGPPPAAAPGRTANHGGRPELGFSPIGRRLRSCEWARAERECADVRRPAGPGREGGGVRRGGRGRGRGGARWRPGAGGLPLGGLGPRGRSRWSPRSLSPALDGYSDSAHGETGLPRPGQEFTLAWGRRPGPAPAPAAPWCSAAPLCGREDTGSPASKHPGLYPGTEQEEAEKAFGE